MKSTPRSIVAGMYRNTAVSTRFMTALAGISLVFGFWGWFALRHSLCLNIGDVIYRSIAALSLSVPYQTSSLWASDWRIETARWAGMAALIIGASKTAVVLFSGHWRRSRWQRDEGHWLIIGNDPFAKALGQAARVAGKRIHWLCAPAGESNSDKPGNVVDVGAWTLSSATRHGLNGAAGVVVATSDDATSHAIAHEVRTQRPDSAGCKVLVSLRSPWLAMRIDELEYSSSVTVFSEAQIAVRRIQRRHPPFLLAAHLKQQRVHVVIIGFGIYGEAVLIETLLSSLTSRQGVPVITIVDPAASLKSAELHARYPELDDSVELRFVDCEMVSAKPVITDELVRRVSNEDPVSCWYVCLPDESTSLVSAISLQMASRRSSLSDAPVCIRVDSPHSLPDVPVGVSALLPGQLIAFGALQDLARETGLFSPETDRLAREFHERYAEAASEDKPAKVSWDDLSEDMKDSNRRLLVHIPAKLYSVGFDVESWLIASDSHPGKPQIPRVQGLLDRPEIIEELARLEHERWMADRRLNGWTLAPVRDDQRRHHPDLVAFDQLSESSRDYDRLMIRTFIKVVSG